MHLIGVAQDSNFSRMYRIKKVSVKWLSLCKRGANQMPVLYKSEDGTASVQTIVKEMDSFDEQGELLAIGYIPEYVDSHGHGADASVCKEMAHTFMRNGAKLDIRHNNKLIARDRAYVAESFIIQPDDPRFRDIKDYSGNPVDPTGGWATLIKIEDPELRKLYREEGWDGVSFEGPAQLEKDESPDFEKISKALKSFTDRLNQESEDMKPEELEAILKKQGDSTVAALKEAISPLVTELKKTTDALAKDADEADTEPDEKGAKDKSKKTDLAKSDKSKAPVFEGDPDNPEEVEAHLKKMRRFELRKSVKWDDAESVREYHVKLRKLEDEDEGPGDDADDDDYDGSDEDLRKEERRSSVPAVDTKRGSGKRGGYQGVRLTKEEDEGRAAGQRMAAAMNARYTTSAK